jgi:hypothetical protein
MEHRYLQQWQLTYITHTSKFRCWENTDIGVRNPPRKSPCAWGIQNITTYLLKLENFHTNKDRSWNTDSPGKRFENWNRNVPRESTTQQNKKLREVTWERLSFSNINISSEARNNSKLTILQFSNPLNCTISTSTGFEYVKFVRYPF